MPDSSDVPHGLVIWSVHTPTRRHRRSRMAFAAVVTAAAAALVWPVYGLFSAVEPMILGLPLSLAWVVVWMTLVFAALAWLYRRDHADGNGGPQVASRVVPIRAPKVTPVPRPKAPRSQTPRSEA